MSHEGHKTGLNATLGFGTSSITPKPIKISLPELSAQEFDDTDITDAVVKMTKSGVVDPGEITVDARFDPDWYGLIDADDEEVTVSIPRAGYTDQTTVVFTGHVSKVGAGELVKDDRFPMSVTLRINSIPVVTEASTPVT
jgi:hypothetical protein